MYKTSIFLSSIESVKKFVTLSSKYDFPVNLVTDKYMIDAKSIMGIFSLDLSKPLTLEVEDDGSAEVNDFIESLETFKYDKVAVEA
jgi:phosphotransferase system HPr-like phosphotransfer protein